MAWTPVIVGIDGGLIHKGYHAYTGPNNAVTGLVRVLVNALTLKRPVMAFVAWDTQHTWRHERYDRYKANRAPMRRRSCWPNLNRRVRPWPVWAWRMWFWKGMRRMTSSPPWPKGQRRGTGVKGVGKKTALALLKEYGDLDGVLKNAWQIKGAIGRRIYYGNDEALLWKELTTVCREAPVSITAGELKWQFDPHRACACLERLGVLDEGLRGKLMRLAGTVSETKRSAG